eukprot:1488306-Pyramimonas_sp.AAC.1
MSHPILSSSCSGSSRRPCRLQAAGFRARGPTALPVGLLEGILRLLGSRLRAQGDPGRLAITAALATCCGEWGGGLGQQRRGTGDEREG